MCIYLSICSYINTFLLSLIYIYIYMSFLLIVPVLVPAVLLLTYVQIYISIYISIIIYLSIYTYLLFMLMLLLLLLLCVHLCLQLHPFDYGAGLLVCVQPCRKCEHQAFTNWQSCFSRNKFLRRPTNLHDTARPGCGTSSRRSMGVACPESQTALPPSRP